MTPLNQVIKYLETEVEVLYVDILIWSSFALAPQQESLLGCHLFNRDILDGESQNNGPDHAQCHFKISIDNFFGANWDELNTFGCNKVKGFVYVSNLFIKKNNEEKKDSFWEKIYSIWHFFSHIKVCIQGLWTEAAYDWEVKIFIKKLQSQKTL